MTVTQAVCLVGGRGTRLGSLTDELPKPMLDVGGRPFLDYIVHEARRFGLTELLLLTGYLLYLEQKKAEEVELAFFRINAVAGFAVFAMVLIGVYI